MTRVKAHQQQATAYQYLPETEAMLAELDLPTGKVTVQKRDELNRTPGRCYVMTSWGTAILNEGDWVVLYDVGIVVAVTAAQYPLLFDIVTEEVTSEELNPGAHTETYGKSYPEQRVKVFTEGLISPTVAEVPAHPELFTLHDERLSGAAPVPERVPVMRFRATEDTSSWVPSFEAYCVRYRLDYALETIRDEEQFTSWFYIRVGATGREVLSFGAQQLIDCYADGELRIVNEA